MKLTYFALKKYFDRDLNDFHFIPLLYLHFRNGHITKIEMQKFLGESLLNTKILDYLEIKNHINSDEFYYHLNDRGVLNLFFNGQIKIPSVEITSNIANLSFDIILKSSQNIINKKNEIMIYNSDSAELLSLVKAIEAEFDEKENIVTIKKYDVDKLYYYSGLKNYSEILEKYDKLNFIIKYYEKFKMGLGLQRLTEFKANYKTELNLISHPKFNEYNYLSYLPSNTSENILSLRKNQLIYFDKTDKILLPTSKGISINSIINKSINFYEDLLKINTINSKIIELST